MSLSMSFSVIIIYIIYYTNTIQYCIIHIILTIIVEQTKDEVEISVSLLSDSAESYYLLDDAAWDASKELWWSTT